MKRVVLAIVVLGLLGAAKIPFETDLSRKFREAHFHQGQVNLSMRNQLGQMGSIAALSGFRSVVADYLWIRAHVAWEHTEWGRMKLLFDAVTSLQPRSLLFWEGASWHMAYNASVAAMRDDRQPREALRIRSRDEFYRIGEDYLLRGINYNPERAELFDRLGTLYRDKMKDHCKAAWAYFEAEKRPDAMGYVPRMAAYELAACPGHEQEAYGLLVDLFHQGKQQRLPTLLILIDKLQKELQIPVAERIDITADLREGTPR